MTPPTDVRELIRRHSPTTSVEDKRIVELNQAGVNSRYFEPGPYSLQESYARRFVDWYLTELAGP